MLFVLLSFNRTCDFSWSPSTKVATAYYLQSAHSVLLAQVYTNPLVTIHILQQFVRNALKPTPVVSGASQKWESSLSDVNPAESSWDPCGWKVPLSLTPGWIHNGLWFFPSFPGIGYAVGYAPWMCDWRGVKRLYYNKNSGILWRF